MRSAGTSAAVLLVLLAACGGHGADEHGADEHGAGAHAHVHAAPHGGALVVLGEELAHVELLLDAERGRLTAWVLDDEADYAVRLAQPELVVRVEPETGDAAGAGPARDGDAGPDGAGAAGATFVVRLAAQASALTGETVGDSSEFAGSHPRLVGARRWRGVLEAIDVRGASFRDVAFRYPEGDHAAHEAGDDHGVRAEDEDDHR